MIGSWVTGGLVAVGLTLGGVAWYQTMRLDTALAELALERAKLQTCGGRLDAVLRDVQSDNAIDNLDLLDFDIPDDWLLEGTDTGSP